MSNMKCRYSRICAIAGVAGLLQGAAYAAVLNVPTIQYPNLYDAIPAAQDGDEIRVANDYTETLGYIELSNKSISIQSYTPDFSSPAAGAQWDNIVAGDVNSAFLSITNGALHIEGFSNLRAPDGNVFLLNSNSDLTVRGCTFTGIVRADTAGIKTGPDAENVSVLLEDTEIVTNGRGIWFNQVRGNSSLVLENCHIEENSSYPIEWRTNRGDHTFEIRDSFVSVTNSRAIRMYNFNTTNGELATNNIAIERCEFISAPTGVATLILSGVQDSADPNSTTTMAVTNCTFDLRQAQDSVNTVALDVIEDSTRRSEVTFEHCTIAVGGENQCGVRFREHQSTLHMRNSIIDGNGEGNVALRSLRGLTISYMNLLNTPVKGQSFLGGEVQFSGDELLDVSPEFVDISNADFQLSSTSPALAAGEDIGVVTDILGNARPNPAGSDPDLGAYEMADIASVSDWAVY